ncbi:MAG: phytanoyl-CoA dioxygenase family protein [Candidatus Latescibacteria bacterium]|nr:phytanoyl-CoA dioxygenase family protein [Candidatus Latescibacterota bacterium]
MIDMTSKAREVRDLGYCVLEAVYDEDECQEIRILIDRLCAQRGGPSADAPRLVFHPLLRLCPEMGPFFGKAEVIEALAAVLQDDVRLAHSGGAVSNEQTKPYISGWHHHYHWEVPPGGLNRENPERVLGNVYTDGLSPEIGPLIVLPRGLNDSTNPRLDDRGTDWPGQVAVSAPPGSVVIFDTALWHSAKRGTRPGLRHLWGGHYQGWHNPKPHPEDNESDSPGLADYKRDLPALRRLIDGP